MIELARYLRNNNGRRAKDKRPGIWDFFLIDFVFNLFFFFRVGLISIFVYMKEKNNM